MTIKNLIDQLAKYPADANIYITLSSYQSMVFPIEEIGERYTSDEDEPPIVVIRG